MNKAHHIWENRASKTVRLLSLLPKRPVEFYDRVMTVLERTTEAAGGLQDSHGQAMAFTDALSAALCVSTSDIESLLAESQLRRLEEKVVEQITCTRSTGPFDLGHNGNFCLAKTIYVLCRLLSPTIVLETGVAYGVTSAFTLQALAINGKGSLISVDLPPLGKDADRYVGALIPQELRGRWQLHRGPAKRILPNLVTSIKLVDLFVHDSLHTYRHMNFEFETVWPHLRPGSAVVADNVDLNDAFREFAVKVQPTYSALVKEENATDLFGILIKRA
jgi:Methyltransferase domain